MNAKYILLFPLISFISTTLPAQNFYESGYFVTTDGKVTEALIFNEDWKSNPEEFTYKLSEESKALTHNLESVIEFGLGGHTKFVRATVNIDQSSNQLSRLSSSRTPNFELKTVFLKIIIAGKATLYSYKSGTLSRFLYSVDGSDIEQLIYRRFLIGETIVEDKKFQDQLKLKVSCNEFINQDPLDTKIKYLEDELVGYFKEFNSCTGSTFIVYKDLDTEGKNYINISAKPGINVSSFDIFGFQSGNKKFDTDTFLKFGIELELILPYNNNKWGIIFEPTYQKYKTPGSPSPGSGFTLDYSSIEFPIGLRYNMFINSENRIWINGFLVLDLPLKNEFKFGVADVRTRMIPNGVFGIGYKFKNKISFESKFSSKRFFYSKGSQQNVAYYQYFSLGIGYTFY